MAVKPEDRPKLAALAAAIGVIFCYLIFFIVPQLSHAQGTPGPTVTSPAQEATAPSAAAPAAARIPNLRLLATPMTDEKATSDVVRDPFASPASESATVSTEPKAAAVSAPAAVKAAPPGAATSPLPMNAPATVQVVQAAVPSVTLLGLVGGEEAVAVFQIGDATVEMKKGETLPGGLRLRSVDAEGVTLSKDKTTYRVEVGNEVFASHKKGS